MGTCSSGGCKNFCCGDGSPKKSHRGPRNNKKNRPPSLLVSFPPSVGTARFARLGHWPIADRPESKRQFDTDTPCESRISERDEIVRRSLVTDLVVVATLWLLEKNGLVLLFLSIVVLVLVTRVDSRADKPGSRDPCHGVATTRGPAVSNPPTTTSLHTSWWWWLSLLLQWLLVLVVRPQSVPQFDSRHPTRLPRVWWSMVRGFWFVFAHATHNSTTIVIVTGWT